MSAAVAKDGAPFVTFTLAGQLCGVPVTAVRDVLRHQPIAPVPLAPPDVAGNLNLRGRIVTAINLRRRLGLQAAGPDARSMALVTEREGELYALLVDQVFEVLSPDTACFQATPVTLPAIWTRYSTGLYRLEKALMIVLNLPKLLATRDDAQ